jgi:hypothetical protein
MITRWRGGPVSTLQLSHGAERIEAMGADAVVVGESPGAMTMSTIRLDAQPRVGGTLTQRGAAEAETRTHSFLYRADGADAGTFGLPIISVQSGRGRAARILFVRNRESRLTTAGALCSRADHEDDDCRASCVDWYGESRPVFWDRRVFALLGYELVEGRITEGAIQETRRLDFTPRSGRLNAAPTTN